MRGCPFGLDIVVSCHNVGPAIQQMQPLDGIAKEQKDKYAKANRRVYLASMTGERCPFADKFVGDKEMVICDYDDAAPGEHDLPIRPSPFYPRVFNQISGAGAAGFGQWGLYSIPIGAYQDNSDAQQIFSGMTPMYGSAAVAPEQIEKTSQTTPNSGESTNYAPLYYEFEESVLTEELNGNH